MVQESSTAHEPAAITRFEVRRVTVADLREALARGMNDFNAVPTHIPFVFVIYPFVALLAGRVAAGYEFLPLAFPILAGFTLIGPLVVAGMYELSRRREQGLDLDRRHALEVLRSPAIRSIIALGLVLLAIFLAWVAAAWQIYAMTMGPAAPESLGGFVTALFTTEAGWALIVVGNLVGLLFAIVVLGISVVSFPLMLDRHADVFSAVWTSLRAVAANPGPMAVWGLIVAFSLIGGAIPFLVGLAVVIPVLGHATWHLYRAVVGP